MHPLLLLKKHFNNIKMPFSIKAICYFFIAFKNSLIQQRVNKVFKAIKTITTKISIFKHKNYSLCKAIILKKKVQKGQIVESL
jgi:hypothetical protein